MIKNLPNAPTPDDVTFFSSGRVDAAVRDRIVIERAVVRHAATALIAAGFELRLHDGEDYATERTTSVDRIMAELMATDEERLYAYAPGGKFHGSVYLVYGNDGYDVITDNSVSLAVHLEATDAFSDTLMPGA
ncbi:hypothetical protein [Variovorax sp. LT1R16]|uniref:hypothetical protein n=1 Tax=Variovorax sp. LT1R16 TaxID=3443728 RepID=UPI003F4511E6